MKTSEEELDLPKSRDLEYNKQLSNLIWAYIPDKDKEKCKQDIVEFTLNWLEK